MNNDQKYIIPYIVTKNKYLTTKKWINQITKNNNTNEQFGGGVTSSIYAIFYNDNELKNNILKHYIGVDKLNKNENHKKVNINDLIKEFGIDASLQKFPNIDIVRNIFGVNSLVLKEGFDEVKYILNINTMLKSLEKHSNENIIEYLSKIVSIKNNIDVSSNDIIDIISENKDVYQDPIKINDCFFKDKCKNDCLQLIANKINKTHNKKINKVYIINVDRDKSENILMEEVFLKSVENDVILKEQSHVEKEMLLMEYINLKDFELFSTIMNVDFDNEEVETGRDFFQFVPNMKGGVDLIDAASKTFDTAENVVDKIDKIGNTVDKTMDVVIKSYELGGMMFSAAEGLGTFLTDGYNGRLQNSEDIKTGIKNGRENLKKIKESKDELKKNKKELKKQAGEITKNTITSTQNKEKAEDAEEERKLNSRKAEYNKEEGDNAREEREEGREERKINAETGSTNAERTVYLKEEGKIATRERKKLKKEGKIATRERKKLKKEGDVREKRIEILEKMMKERNEDMFPNNKKDNDIQREANALGVNIRGQTSKDEEDEEDEDEEYEDEEYEECGEDEECEYYEEEGGEEEYEEEGEEEEGEGEYEEGESQKGRQENNNKRGGYCGFGGYGVFNNKPTNLEMELCLLH
jgi:hypothetical protein